MAFQKQNILQQYYKPRHKRRADRRFRFMKGYMRMSDYEIIVIVLMIIGLVVQVDNHSK